MFADAFHEVAVLVLAAALAGALAVRLRQPLIVAFIAVGVLAGPSALDAIRAGDEIHLLAELGIALVLFVVGLKLDVRVIRDTGGVALITGAVQVALTAAAGFGLAVSLGIEPATAAYVAMALAFSSTIVVVKLLSDRREIDELHGRIAVGVLIVQDLVVIGAIIALTALGDGDAGGGVAAQAGWVVAKGLALLAGIALITRFALTAALHRIARTPELLVLCAIAWAVGLAALADGLGFSGEVGAFLAGVALASTPYRDAIGGRLVPLRDFLLLFFFLDLGAGLDLGGLGDQLVAALVLSAFVLIAKPLIVVAVTGRLGYTSRVGFLAGASLSQISEFSLILAALGLSLGHLDGDGVALITAIALVTISLSTYATLHAHDLHAHLRPWLRRLERRGRPLRGEPGLRGAEVDVIVLGAGRFGGALLGPLRAAGHRVLAVDFDPRVIEVARARGELALYGDAEDPELPAALPLDGVRWIVCTVRRPEVGLALLHALEHHRYAGRVALSAHGPEAAEELLARGAHHVLRPYEAAGAEALAMLAARLPEPRGSRPRRNAALGGA